jgi:hypothetical protein
MHTDAWLLSSWVLVGAAWLFVHVFVVWLVVRRPEVTRARRLLALLPPAAPFIAWSRGARTAPVAWLTLGALYLVLRLSG